MTVFDIAFLALALFFVFRLRSFLSTSDKAIKRQENKQLQEIKKCLTEDQRGLLDKLDGIKKIDPEFNSVDFLVKAQELFIDIITVFNKGDEIELKKLVKESVWHAFIGDIRKRKKNYNTNIEVLRVKRSEIKDAYVGDKTVSVDVEFISEQIVVVKDEKGNIIEGDDNKVIEVNDKWRFVKNTSEKKANWVLESTFICE